MRINTNVAALNSYNQLNQTNNKLSKSLERLSSGKRINGAADDAAGLAISEKMGSQTRGLAQAQRNAQDAISMNQTAEGALKESHSILQRMRELSVQSANDTNTSADRAEIQEEVNQLSKELTRISETTEFNTQKLLDGTLENTFQIGANEGQNMELGINNMSAEALNVVSDTVGMGQSGEGVTGVDADLDFNLNDLEMTASEAGAIEAKLSATEVDNDGFVKDTSMSYAVGVTESGSGVDFVDNKISVDDTYSEFNWNDINTGGTNSVTVAKTTNGLQVVVDAEDNAGNTITSTDEYATFNEATGNYEYDNHGVSFSITEDEFNSLSDGADDLSIDMNAYADSNIGSIGDLGTASNYTQTGLSTPSEAAQFSDITYDQSAMPEDAYSIKVNASSLSGTGSADNAGTFEVNIYDEAGNSLATDTFTFASGEVGDTYSYNNHGVSFDINNLDAALSDGVTAIDFTGGETDSSTAIGIVDNSVTISSGSEDLALEVSDQTGTEQTLNVTLQSGEQDIQNVVDKINDAATDAGFTSDIASVVDGNIELAALDTGEDSTINVSGGAASAIFADTTASGDDESIDLTLNNSSGQVGTTQSIAPDATSVSFKDSNQNEISFDLKGYSSLSDVNVAQSFNASDFSREVSGIDVTSQEAADSAISTIDDAIANVSSERSKLGAVQNRLEHTINNLNTAEENLTAAESRISDVDMAREMMNMSKQQILSQAGTAMMAQANQLPQGVLQLLG